MADRAPRFIAYLRVSTAEQADSGLGLDAQEHTIREAAERRGWQLVDVVRDAGRSGANLKRPGITKVLKAIAKGDADGLVVAKLDRVSRSSTDTSLLIDWFQSEARADFVALDVEWADTTHPTGRMMVGMIALFAEWERGQTAQRTSAALQRLKARGEKYGPGAVTDETRVASDIRRWRDDGATYQEICRRLNDAKVPTPRGGSTWRPSSLQTILGPPRQPKRKARASLPRVARGRR